MSLCSRTALKGASPSRSLIGTLTASASCVHIKFCAAAVSSSVFVAVVLCRLCVHNGSIPCVCYLQAERLRLCSVCHGRRGPVADIRPCRFCSVSEHERHSHSHERHAYSPHSHTDMSPTGMLEVCVKSLLHDCGQSDVFVCNLRFFVGP